MSAGTRAALGPNPFTISDAIDEGVRRLKAAGIDRPRAEARLLAAAALGVGPAAMIGAPDRALSAAERDLIAGLVARRAGREPVSRIAGQREFWSLDFALGPETLDPRPDSESLVEAALADIRADGARDAPVSVLDLGTGTGCLLLAVLSELPSARGLGVDISAAACAVARDNAARHGLSDRVRFAAADWADGIDARFDLILSNPPYLQQGAIDHLMPEVARFDPRRALDGGADGLDAYRAIAPRLDRLARPGARAVVEIGDGQAADVTAIFAAAGWATARVAADLSGTPRCLVLRQTSAA